MLLKTKKPSPNWKQKQRERERHLHAEKRAQQSVNWKHSLSAIYLLIKPMPQLKEGKEGKQRREKDNTMKDYWRMQSQGQRGGGGHTQGFPKNEMKQSLIPRFITAERKQENKCKISKKLAHALYRGVAKIFPLMGWGWGWLAKRLIGHWRTNWLHRVNCWFCSLTLLLPSVFFETIALLPCIKASPLCPWPHRLGQPSAAVPPTLGQNSKVVHRHKKVADSSIKGFSLPWQERSCIQIRTLGFGETNYCTERL